MAPLRSLVVVLLLAAYLAHSLPQDGPSRDSDFMFADKTRVLASRVPGRDLTRPRRQSSSRRLVDYGEGSGKLEYKDERDVDGPGTDSPGSAFDIRERSCPGDNTYTCVSGDTICKVNICDGNEDCPDGDDEQECECSSEQILCDKTICIPKDLRCDGVDDCADKTDEQNCTATCAPTEFTCSDGSCAANEETCPTTIAPTNTSTATPPPATCAPSQVDCGGGLCAADKDNCPTTATTPTTTTTTTPTTTTTNTTTTCAPSQVDCGGGLCAADKENCPSTTPTTNTTTATTNCTTTTPTPTTTTTAPTTTTTTTTPTTTTTTTTPATTTTTTATTPTTISTTTPRGCGAGQWPCRDGGCISEKHRCDGCVHCRDGSDEEGCRPKQCRHWEFRCRDGSCINKRLHCNGCRDCRDGSDEWHCRLYWVWPRPWHHGRNRFTEADPNLREEALL